MPGIAGMGLSAGPEGDVPRIRFFSDTASSRLEFAQITLDEGPCRDATSMRRPVLASDLATETWRQRWPRFTPAALEAGVRAVFALPLHAGGVRHDGAVDLYRRTPGPLSDAERSTATTFAAATAELLTLERLDLDLADVFADPRRSTRPANASHAASPLLPAAPPPAPGEALLACWFDSAMLGPVRGQIRALATEQGMRIDETDRLVLCVHEAVTNVVRHGGGHGQLLLWRRAGHLWCEISDHGPGVPPISDHSTTAHLAWGGLNIIRRACTSLAITTDTTGTRLLLSCRVAARTPR